jgi:hypothetical protein
MIHIIGSVLGIVVMVLAPACGRQESANSSWSVRVDTSGGFAGIGNGSIAIDSKGKSIYIKPTPRNMQATPCEANLTKEQLRDISEAVSLAKPEGWKVAGLGVAAPDAFGYVLSLKRGSETYKVMWYDNTQDQLPADLSKLYAALDTVKESQAEKCEGH